MKMAETGLKFIADKRSAFGGANEVGGFTKGKVGINSKR